MRLAFLCFALLNFVEREIAWRKLRKSATTTITERAGGKQEEKLVETFKTLQLLRLAICE